MQHKSDTERMQENHNLLDLVVHTNFKKYDPSDQLPSPIEGIEGRSAYIFHRKLGEGVEIFYFFDPSTWYQDKQMEKRGLEYYCLATPERIAHELEFFSNVRSVYPTPGKGAGYVLDRRRILGAHGVRILSASDKVLHLDVMFPDKWAHFALEILLRYAHKEEEQQPLIDTSSLFS